MQEQINAVNQTVAQQKATVQDTYNAEISKTKQDYDDEHQRNLVQKYVNEQQIAENMANMGLTDSGLNRTQQTAAQLSYSNTASKIDRQLQSAVDSFVLTMNSKLTDIETSRIGSEATIKKSYDDSALTAAQDEYKVENDTETERQKAYYSALEKVNSQKLTTGINSNIATWKNASSGNVTYTDTSGNSVTVPAKHNPYNNKYNADAENGTYSNGYQPNNISGTKLKNSGTKISTIDVLGQEAQQTVWQYKDGNKTKYAVWSGSDNAYYEIKTDKNGDWVVVGKASVKS